MSFTKERLVLDLPLTERPWEIGYAGGKRWWTNQALANVNGSLTNDKLLRMTDDELRQLALADGNPTSEQYRRPSTKVEADRQGGAMGEAYVGTHRAYILLEYRKAKALDNAR